MLRTVGGGVWKARLVLSARLREPKNMLGGLEGLEDPSDCLGPDEMAKKLFGKVGGGVWKAPIILSHPVARASKKLLGRVGGRSGRAE